MHNLSTITFSSISLIPLISYSSCRLTYLLTPSLEYDEFLTLTNSLYFFCNFYVLHPLTTDQSNSI